MARTFYLRALAVVPYNRDTLLFENFLPVAGVLR